MNKKQIQPLLFNTTLIALMLLTVMALIVARAPYMHDFAEWVYQAQIIKLFILDPASVLQFTMASYREETKASVISAFAVAIFLSHAIIFLPNDSYTRQKASL